MISHSPFSVGQSQSSDTSDEVMTVSLVGAAASLKAQALGKTTSLHVSTASSTLKVPNKLQDCMQ